MTISAPTGLDRDGASAQRLGEEPSRCGKVAVRGEQHIDDLTVLVDRSVQIGPTAGNLWDTSHRRTSGRPVPVAPVVRLR